MRFDLRCAINSLPLGPALVLVGYGALATVHAPITDPMLVALLTYPTAVLLLGAVVTAALRRDPTAWVSMALGATVGTLGAAIIVGGGISALGWMLSDPG
ncbi:hypothetical protein CIW52_00830 [Mycolicibacterium sp. P9-64]|uniref:hypothetical protein n=1 Tax=Mycolicibacterium sp. P9-64 TaxID=2024612 RepID=UPI0011F029EB|nr:hypothetical protein [Mycolicibacterium sp. P9-64]KAA0086513.1 hypothetical protein CIW52_00830 [Mycolicibacterium sp. P9-64]